MGAILGHISIVEEEKKGQREGGGGRGPDWPRHIFPTDGAAPSLKEGDPQSHPFLITDGKHALPLAEYYDVRDFEGSYLEEMKTLLARIFVFRLLIKRVLKKEAPVSIDLKLCQHVVALDGRMNTTIVERLRGQIKKEVKKLLDLLCKPWRRGVMMDDLEHEQDERIAPLNFQELISEKADELGLVIGFPDLQMLRDEASKLEEEAEQALQQLSEQVANKLKGERWPLKNKRCGTIFVAKVVPGAKPMSRKITFSWKDKSGKKGQKTITLYIASKEPSPELSVRFTQSSHGSAVFQVHYIIARLIFLQQRELKEEKHGRRLELLGAE